MHYISCFKNKNKDFVKTTKKIQQDFCVINTLKSIKKLKAAVSVLIDGKEDLIKKSKFIYMKNACISRDGKYDEENPEQDNQFYQFLEGNEK